MVRWPSALRDSPVATGRPTQQHHHMAEFKFWQQETLARFASEAQERMVQQDAEIEALRADLRTALAAYRALLTSSPSISGHTVAVE